jgi:type II secretory pathway pseudopilin PulG
MKQPRRPAVTLIEMQVVITLMAVLLGLTGVCLHGMVRAHDRLKTNTQRRASLDRFSLQLRTDAHAANAARLDDDQATRSLVLTAADTSEIVYRAEASEVSRTVRQGETVRHRDTFQLPAVASAQWEISDGHPQLVEVKLLSADGLDRRTPAVPITIEAAVGLQDHRHMVLQTVVPDGEGGDNP